MRRATSVRCRRTADDGIGDYQCSTTHILSLATARTWATTAAQTTIITDACTSKSSNAATSSIGSRPTMENTASTKDRSCHPVRRTTTPSTESPPGGRGPPSTTREHHDMLVVYAGIALIGAATTTLVLLPLGVEMALIAAPFGGSLSVLATAAIVAMSEE